MTIVTNVLASIGFFIMSIFGGAYGGTYAPPSPTPPSNTHVPSSSNLTVIATTTDGQALYTKDSQYVYNIYNKPIPGADPNTFVAIRNTLGGETDYAKDTNHVYYSLGSPTVIVDGADSKTFIVQADFIPLGGDNGLYSFSYGKDATHIFVGPGLVEGVDAPTFSLIPDGERDWGGFYKDKNHAYVFGHAVPVTIAQADPATFEPILSSQPKNANGEYAKDANHVFFVQNEKDSTVSPTIINNADSNTFVLYNLLQGDFGHDKNQVYNDGQAVVGADPTTFEFIPDSNGDIAFAKDKNAVYVLSWSSDIENDGTLISKDCTEMCPIINGDPATFTLLNTSLYGYAKDKNNVYANAGGAYKYWFKLAGADSATFTVVKPLPQACAEVVGDGDANPSPVPGCYDAKDANHEYFMGQVVQ